MTSDIRPSVLGALHAEALKIWTLTSSRVLLILSTVIIAGSGTVFSLSMIGRLTDPRFAGQSIAAEPAQFVDSVLWAQILLAVLAVLSVTAEYGTGQIRLSLLALPARLPWLAAKAAVLAACGLVVGTVGSGLSLAVSALLLPGSGVAYTVEAGEAVSLALRSGLYLAVIAAFVVGLTAVLRHVVASLSVVLALMIVVPPVLSSIPGVGWLTDYTPTSAGRRLISDYSFAVALEPWAGFGVLLAWTAAALVCAGVLLRRRDA